MAPHSKEHLCQCATIINKCSSGGCLVLPLNPPSKLPFVLLRSQIINRKSNRGSLQFVDINQTLIFVPGRPVNYIPGGQQHGKGTQEGDTNSLHAYILKASPLNLCPGGGWGRMSGEGTMNYYFITRIGLSSCIHCQITFPTLE